MADDRENEGTEREPVGAANGEGRWPADDEPHKYTNGVTRYITSAQIFLLITICIFVLV